MSMLGLGAVTEFERDLLIERTQQDLIRAKAEGKSWVDPRPYGLSVPLVA